ncbi:LADA_0H04654g1_1 [Lachancea dasiensis]|uniref:LADA_0H04654g1_1 n=1 Tax=Lachancea dasiensis TaxID=1072105 RepID=A0A1G4K0S4_9SACH|nr:LADA_0H04654g1_1 [Lachancea dasiensis]
MISGNMLPYSAFTFIAVAWLLYRLVLFLNIPVWRIVSTLGLQVPQTTRVSIDEVTEETITVRWENEPATAVEKTGSSICHYVLYLNNVKIGSIPNIPTSLYTCCLLKGLSPHTQYQFDFVCINQDGFMNKGPSIYVMTKPKGPDKHANQVYQEELDANQMLAPNFPADTKWRKSQKIVTTESPTSYASLTSLPDLDDYSITDLKNILVCAQEDLHDVLQQETSILQDFHESEVQLKLELDNLKAQWAHDIDLRKSLKSSIKSLENSKLLYDLKRGKLDKNIDQSLKKIQKMTDDMARWDQERKTQLRQNALQEQFKAERESLVERIDDVSNQIKALHDQVVSQEEENKKLNSVKKSLDSTQNATSTTTLASTNSSKRNSPVEIGAQAQSLNTIMQKINTYTNERTGVLSGQGHEFLNSLCENSVVVALIKEEAKKDFALDHQWRTIRTKLKRRNDMMESMWTDISLKNRELMASIAAQPYASVNHPSSPNGGTPHLTLHDPSTYVSENSMHDQAPYSNESFRHASPPPSVNGMIYPNWSIPLNGSHQAQANNEDQNFDYDNANHLLSGLQNMISEADYQATNVSTSKLYTTDQLDNYWSRQTNPEFRAQAQRERHPSPPAQLPLQSPASISEPQNFSHSRMLSNESFVPVSVPREDELSGFVHTPMVQRDDLTSFGSGYSNEPAMRTSPLSLPLQEEFSKEGIFGSPHFNTIWNPAKVIETPTVEKHDTPKSQHTRTSSRGSWGLPHFMQKSPNKLESKGNTAGSSNGEHKDRESHGSERRMSKLLTKSGMNHLFRSPTHDSS